MRGVKYTLKNSAEKVLIVNYCLDENYENVEITTGGNGSVQMINQSRWGCQVEISNCKGNDTWFSLNKRSIIFIFDINSEVLKP